MPLQNIPTTGLDDTNLRRRHRELTNGILRFDFDDSRVRTPAEVSAGIIPVNYAYPPGHFLRYGAVGDGVTDNAVAWAAMLNVCSRVGGPCAYIPASPSGFLVNSGYTLTGRVEIVGEGMLKSLIFTTADITLITIPAAASGSKFSNFRLHGPVSSPTTAGIRYINSNSNVLRRVQVDGFRYGVYYEKGLNSCYLNSMYDCLIISNELVNIYGEANTNALFLSNCTFGGGPCQKGLYLVDCNNLCVVGGDAEGLTECVFDLDSSTSTTQAAHLISGFHFEGNTSAQGDVLIGNTQPVNGVTLIGCLYAPGSGNDSAINAIRGDGLAVYGGDLHSGYTGVSFRRIGASFGKYTIQGVGQWPNEFSGPMTGVYVGRKVALVYSTSIDIDASLGNRFEVSISNGTAFAINAPTNPSDGQEIELWFGNSSGGAHGAITMNAAFKMPAAIPAIATGNNRTFRFRYRSASSAWYESFRSAADVPN